MRWSSLLVLLALVSAFECESTSSPVPEDVVSTSTSTKMTTISRDEFQGLSASGLIYIIEERLDRRNLSVLENLAILNKLEELIERSRSSGASPTAPFELELAMKELAQRLKSDYRQDARDIAYSYIKKIEHIVRSHTGSKHINSTTLFFDYSIIISIICLTVCVCCSHQTRSRIR